jgi:uroporphyrinogen III methyltransferase/synthase
LSIIPFHCHWYFFPIDSDLVFGQSMRYIEIQILNHKHNIMPKVIDNKALDTLPLEGRRILITRAREQAEEFSRLLQNYGAHVIPLPTIEIAPPEDWQLLDKTIEKLDSYDWIIFTSVNGVRFFTRRLEGKGKDITDLADKKLCAIGPRTQGELEKLGLTVTFMPTEYRAEGVIEGLKARGIKGQKILLPRARGARKILPEALREAGTKVDEVEVYQAVKPSKPNESLAAILKKGIDVVSFTSSSTVHNFMELLSDKTAINGLKVAVIGPITAETARSYGMEPHITPREYTIPALVEAIVEYFQRRP